MMIYFSHYRLFVFIFLCFAFVFGGIDKAKAQLEVLEGKPLPELELLPKEEFKEQTELLKERPLGLRSLSYYVRLPKDWVRAQQGGIIGGGDKRLSDKVPVQLAEFYGPARLHFDRDRFVVSAMKLPYSMTALQWFYQFVLTRGYSVEGFLERSDTEIEALLVFMDVDKPFSIRFKAIINGGNVLLFEHYVPYNMWNESKVSQAQILDSCEVMFVEQAETEELQKGRFLDIAQVSFPKSWSTGGANLGDLDHMYLEIINYLGTTGASKQFAGKIKLSLIQVGDLEEDGGELSEEMNDIKMNLESQNLRISEEIEVLQNVKIPEVFEFSEIKAYKLTAIKGNILPYELWVYITYFDEYYYIAELLSPAQKSDFVKWSRNIQTLKEVLSKFGPTEAFGKEDDDVSESSEG